MVLDSPINGVWFQAYVERQVSRVKFTEGYETQDL